MRSDPELTFHHVCVTLVDVSDMNEAEGGEILASRPGDLIVNRFVGISSFLTLARRKLSMKKLLTDFIEYSSFGSIPAKFPGEPEVVPSFRCLNPPVERAEKKGSFFF